MNLATALGQLTSGTSYAHRLSVENNPAGRSRREIQVKLNFRGSIEIAQPECDRGIFEVKARHPQLDVVPFYGCRDGIKVSREYAKVNPDFSAYKWKCLLLKIFRFMDAPDQPTAEARLIQAKYYDQGVWFDYLLIDK